MQSLKLFLLSLLLVLLTMTLSGCEGDAETKGKGRGMKRSADGAVKGAGEKNLPQFLQMSQQRRLAMAQTLAKITGR